MKHLYLMTNLETNFEKLTEKLKISQKLKDLPPSEELNPKPNSNWHNLTQYSLKIKTQEAKLFATHLKHRTKYFGPEIEFLYSNSIATQQTIKPYKKIFKDNKLITFSQNKNVNDYNLNSKKSEIKTFKKINSLLIQKYKKTQQVI